MDFVFLLTCQFRQNICALPISSMLVQCAQLRHGCLEPLSYNTPRHWMRGTTQCHMVILLHSKDLQITWGRAVYVEIKNIVRFCDFVIVLYIPNPDVPIIAPWSVLKFNLRLKLHQLVHVVAIGCTILWAHRHLANINNVAVLSLNVILWFQVLFWCYVFQRRSLQLSSHWWRDFHCQWDTVGYTID